MSVPDPGFVAPTTNNEPAAYGGMVGPQPPIPPLVQNEAAPVVAPVIPEAPTLVAPVRIVKSAVSELHEFAVQIGQQLEWIQESECGPAHCKLFSMKVMMGSHEASGSGRSKKTAKQVAAATLLKKLQENLATMQNTNDSQVYGPQLPGTQPNNADTTTNTKTIPGNIFLQKNTSAGPHDNPVSKLQEVTIKHGLGYPNYEVVCEDGPQVLQKFDIKVKVKDMECSGLGRSKKAAKRNAAQAMLDQLARTNTAIGPPQKRMLFVPASDTTENVTS